MAGDQPWAHGPFSARDGEMQDASGNPIRFAGVNWPAHMETMVPEGLQYQSIETIVGRVKEAGMNSIRLTWAVEMVDQILDHHAGQDVPIETAFIQALGKENGTAVYGKVVEKNPSLAGASRLQASSHPSGLLFFFFFFFFLSSPSQTLDGAKVIIRATDTKRVHI
jgi:hypothetical protein